MGADLPGKPVCNCAWLVLFRAGENQDIMAREKNSQKKLFANTPKLSEAIASYLQNGIDSLSTEKTVVTSPIGFHWHNVTGLDKLQPLFALRLLSEKCL